LRSVTEVGEQIFIRLANLTLPLCRGQALFGHLCFNCGARMAGSSPAMTERQRWCPTERQGSRESGGVATEAGTVAIGNRAMAVTGGLHYDPALMDTVMTKPDVGDRLGAMRTRAARIAAASAAE
jgi:hypothetical protein